MQAQSLQEFEDKVYENGVAGFHAGKPYDPYSHPAYRRGWIDAHDIAQAALKKYVVLKGYYY